MTEYSTSYFSFLNEKLNTRQTQAKSIPADASTQNKQATDKSTVSIVSFGTPSYDGRPMQRYTIRLLMNKTLNTYSWQKNQHD